MPDGELLPTSGTAGATGPRPKLPTVQGLLFRVSGLGLWEVLGVCDEAMQGLGYIQGISYSRSRYSREHQGKMTKS